MKSSSLLRLTELELTQTVSLFSESEPIETNDKMASIAADAGTDTDFRSDSDDARMISYCRTNQTFLLWHSLKHGRNPNYQDEETLSSLLHIACQEGNTDCVDLLLEFKADPNIVDETGETPLHYACRTGASECVRCLLKANADPMCMDEFDNTPLHYACLSGASECTRLLLAHKDVDVNSTNVGGLTPLYMACQHKGNGICPFLLLEKGANTFISDRQGFTPLAFAAMHGCPAYVSTLLDHGADPNVVDEYERTPLYMACRFRNTECIRILVNHGGVDVNKGGHNGWTPMHEALHNGEYMMARLLLDKGADLFKKDESGRMPVDMRQPDKHPAITELLLEYTKVGESKAKRGRSE